ncbi:MAG TPA: hypothetical protein VLK78_00845 [Candidatus Angelobacter sp.]|nr:hypothetical protein [Candidatus Angelobacter sp.]
MINAMSTDPIDDDSWPPLPKDGREDETGTYEYILISYRIEDAENVGAVQEHHTEEDD